MLSLGETLDEYTEDMKKYKVNFFQDNIYEVMEFNPDEDSYCDQVFQGTLPECEAWIRLTESGYLT